MRLTPWLSMFSKSPARRKPSSVQAKRRSRAVMNQLECLEDRVLLSTLYVDNTATITGPGTDVFTPTGGSLTSQGGLTFGVDLFATIGDAVAAAQANGAGNDDIYVADGTYNENVTVNSLVTLHGNNDGVDARGARGTETTVTPADPSLGTIILNVTGTNFVVDGFKFTGGTSLGVIQTQSGASFNNLRIADNLFSGYSQSAVFMNRGGTDITIDKNVMNGSSIASSGQAIFCNTQSFNGLWITNNNIINNTGRYGFFVDGNHTVGESATRDPLISGNLFDNNLQSMNLGSRSFGALGTPLTGTYAGTISNNTFSNNVANGVQAGIQHVLFTQNVFSNNGISGLALTSFGNTGVDRGAQNSVISENVFSGSGEEDLVLSASQAANTISTNTVVGNSFGSTWTLTYNGTETINASGNWWGANTPAGVVSGQLNEIQSVTVKSGTNSGQFSLTFGPETTSLLAYNASANDVLNALLALNAFAPGDLVVSGTGSPGLPYIIHFAGTFAQTNVSSIAVNDISLAGSATPRISASTPLNGAASRTTIDYSPWFDSGTDTSGTTGFQGDYSSLHVSAASAQVGGTARIQEAIDLQNAQIPAITTGTVTVESGTYTETISGQVGTLKLNAGAVGNLSGTVTGLMNGNAGTLNALGTGTIGTFSAGNGLSFGASGVLQLEVNQAAGAHDMLDVNGTVTLGGATLTPAIGAFVPADGAEIILIDNDGVDTVSGTFAGLPDGAVVSGLNAFGGKTGRISYTGGDGNDVSIRIDLPTLTITAPPSDTVADTFTLVVTGDTLQTYINGALVDTRPLDGIQNFVINGNGDDNTLNLNFANGNPIPLSGLTFNGGAGFDRINLQNVGGTFTTHTYNYTNANDGSIVLNDGTNHTITYTGLEPITNDGDATNIIFNLPNTADATISLADLGVGFDYRLLSGGPGFEQTDFDKPNAGGSITINLGTSDQTIAVNSLTGLNANTSLTIDGQGGTDTIHLNAAGLSITGGLTLRAETIDQANAVTVTGATLLDAGSGGTITLATAGNNFNTVAITAAGTAAIREDGDYVIAGATATTSITLESTGTVTETAAINTGTLTLQGTGGTFTLNSQNNDVNTLDANNSALTTLTFRDDDGFDIAGATATGAVTFSSTSPVTQSAVISGTTLTLLGTGGAFNLGTQNNDFDTLDADTNQLASLAYQDNDGFDVAGVNTLGNTTLNSTGAVTQSVVITAGGLELLGAGGSFTLNTQNNPITTLAGNTGTVLFQDNTGFAIGTVNTAGLTASVSTTLTSTGTVTQSQAVVTPILNLTGANGTFSLGSNNNDVDTLDANTSTLTSLTFRDDDGFDIAGATASGAVTFSSTSAVTQSAVISGTTLTLLGTGGAFNLGTQNNDFNTLDADNNTLASLSYRDDDGFDIAGIHTSGNTTLSSTSAITQSGVITASGLELLGATGTYTLTLNNAVTTLAGDTATVSFRDNSGFSIGTVNTAGLTAATSATLSSTGSVTQSQAVVTPTLTLTGTAGSFNLGTQNNNVTTVDADTNQLTTLSFRDDNGFDVSGSNTSGNTSFSSTGPVTQSGVITASGLELLGAGGTFTFNTQNNPITTLAGNTGTVLFQDNTGFAIGTVNTVGLTATTAATLTSTGTVTETQPITTPTLTLTGTGGTFSLGSQNNAVTTLDANNTVLNTLSFRDDTGFDVAGATMTGGLTLNASATGAITQSSLISAGITNLTGGAITLTLANVLGALTVNNGTGAVSITENDTIDVSLITHNTGNLTLQAGANTINVNGAINITGGNASFLTTGTLNLYDNVTATVISGTPTIVNVNNNTAQIQDGVDAALAGATVNVTAASTFNENVSIPKNLNLVATIDNVTINGGAGGAALTVTAGTVNITGFYASNAAAASTVVVSGGVVTLRNNVIVESSTSSQAAITVSAGTLNMGVSGTSTPGNNSISVNGAGTLLSNAVAVDASGNYWGTSVFATITAGISSPGTVDYTPYLNLGTNLAGIGFQGDFSDLTAHAGGSQLGVVAITEAYNMLTAVGTIHALTGSYTESVDLGAGTNKAVTFAAGASPGQVDISGSLTLTSNDTLPIELTGYTPPDATGPTGEGTNFDNFTVHGTVTLGNATLVPTISYAAHPYDRFTIINNLSGGAVVGTFGGQPEGSVINVNGVRLRVSYKEFHQPSSSPSTPSFFGDGDDVSLTVMLPPILVTQGVNGDLTLDGTGWNDDLTLSFTGTNQLTLIGNDVTNFTGPLTSNIQLAGPYTVTGNITIKLGNGNDKVLIRGVGANATYDSGDLTIDLGADDDTVTTIDTLIPPTLNAGLKMTGNLSIIGGAGTDNVTLGSVTATDTLLARDVTIDTGTGLAQTISLDRLTATRNVTLTNGGSAAQTVAMGVNAANVITGNLVINQLASALSYTVGIHNTSVGGFLNVTNGNGSGAAAVTIDTTTAQVVNGATTITNGNNLTNAVTIVGTTGGLQLKGSIAIKNGIGTNSNGITITDITNSGNSATNLTNGASPANTITFNGALSNTFLGLVTATNGPTTGTNTITATRLSSTKGLNLNNGAATVAVNASNIMTIGGAGATELVSVTGNLVISNGAAVTTTIGVDNLTTLGANAVGNVTINNQATGAGGTGLTFGANAANSISGNLQITNQSSSGLRSVVMNQTNVSGRTGVNIYEAGTGNTSLTIGDVAASTISKGLVVQDGTGSSAVALLNLTVGSFNYADLGGGTDTLNLADTAGTLRVSGVTRIDTGAGSDTVRIATTGTAILNDTVFIALGSGNDLLFIGTHADSPAFNSASKFMFDGGTGTDIFNASPLSIAEYTGSLLGKKVKSKIMNFETLSINP